MKWWEPMWGAIRRALELDQGPFEVRHDFILMLDGIYNTMQDLHGMPATREVFSVINAQIQMAVNLYFDKHKPVLWFAQDLDGGTVLMAGNNLGRWCKHQLLLHRASNGNR